jgi:hypothetical protein
MKDITRKTLEAYRPSEDALRCLNFCLGQLFADRRKSRDDIVAGCCTYEELIGALLLARDRLKQDKKLGD